MLHNIVITDAQLEKLDDGKHIDTFLEGRVVRIKKITAIPESVSPREKADKHVLVPA